MSITLNYMYLSTFYGSALTSKQIQSLRHSCYNRKSHSTKNIIQNILAVINQNEFWQWVKLFTGTSVLMCQRVACDLFEELVIFVYFSSRSPDSKDSFTRSRSPGRLHSTHNSRSPRSRSRSISAESSRRLVYQSSLRIEQGLFWPYSFTYKFVILDIFWLLTGMREA